MRLLRIVYPLLASVLLAACSSSTIPSSERQQVREQVLSSAEAGLAQLNQDNTELESQLAEAAGYFSVDMSAYKIPGVGTANGIGALYDKRNDAITYMNVSRYDLGLGLGVSNYQLISIFEDQVSLEAFRRGGWEGGVSAEWRVGERAGTAYSTLGVNQTNPPTYVLADSGASLTGTAVLLKVEQNDQLTDSGQSKLTRPMKSGKVKGAQQQLAPRKSD